MISRRRFISMSASILAAVCFDEGRQVLAKEMNMQRDPDRSRISLVRTGDRVSGIKKAIALLDINPVKGKDVLLKPNFNTADPFPASTHNDTLIQLISNLKDMGAVSITIGERSGPPDSADVMKDKGIYELSKKLGAGLMDFEELPQDKWVRVRPERSHWRDGFDVAKPVLDSECIVTTCCLKTHAYGGVFTMSLKLSVGMTHKRNMAELHSSFLGMRKMIAEINQVYTPSIILLDGIEVFTDKGPMEGPRKKADVILAGTDRIAIDAVGLAILKELGSNKAIMNRKIFEQEQISRAVELGLGVSRPEDIEIVAEGTESRKYAETLQKILIKG